MEVETKKRRCPSKKCNHKHAEGMFCHVFVFGANKGGGESSEEEEEEEEDEEDEEEDGDYDESDNDEVDLDYLNFCIS